MTTWPDFLVGYRCRLCGGASDLAVTDARLPDGTSTEICVVGVKPVLKPISAEQR